MNGERRGHAQFFRLTSPAAVAIACYLLVLGPVAGRSEVPGCVQSMERQAAYATPKRPVEIRWHIKCVPKGHELTDAEIAWGDGSSSTGTVTYKNSDRRSGFKVAVVAASHRYAPRRPRSPSCRADARRRRLRSYDLAVTYTDTGSDATRVRADGFTVFLCTPKSHTRR